MKGPFTFLGVSLMTTLFLAGCAGLLPNSVSTEEFPRHSAAIWAKDAGMGKKDIALARTNLDRVSEILTTTTPPDFQKARTFVNQETPSEYQSVLFSVVTLVEITVMPELVAKNPETGKARKIIRTVISEAKKGLELG